MRQREDGFCLAYSKSDGKAFVLPRSEYPRLKSEWMAGRAFFEGEQFYGGPITLKLGDVMGVTDISADCDRAMREDERSNAKEDALHD